MATREDYDIVLSATDQTGAAFASAQGNAKALAGAVGAVSEVAAAMGLALSGAAIVSFAKDAVSSLSDIGNVAQRVGTTTDALQALRFEVAQHGGTSDAADQALQRFADTMSKAGTGSNYLSKELALNGVSLKDSQGNWKDTSQLITDYARLVANASSPQDALRLSVEAFGKGAGPQMVAVLKQIATDGLPAMIDQAKQAGAVIDQSMIEKAEELDRQWKSTSTAISNYLKQLAVDVVDTLNKPPPAGSLLELIFTTDLDRKIDLTVDAVAPPGSMLDWLWQTARGAAVAVLGQPSLDFSARFGNGGVKPPTVQTQNWAGATSDYLKASSAATDAGQSLITAWSGATTKMALANDALQKQIDTITRHVAAMEADATTVDAGAAAHEALRVKMQLLEVAQQHGISTAGAYGAAIDAIAQRAGAAAQALALAKLQSDATFDNATIGLSSDEQKIASAMRTVYGGDWSQYMDSAVASSMRFNNALHTAHDTGLTFLQDFNSGLQQGQTVWQSFEAAGLKALTTIENKLLEMAYNQLWNAAFPSSGSGGFNFLSILGFGASGSPGGGASENGGNIVGSAYGNIFDRGLKRFAKGGIVDSPTLFPFANGTGLMGEAGPEAVMPLKRGSDGRLGVAAGGGGALNQKIVVNNYGADVQSRTDDQGNIELTVRAITRDEMASSRTNAINKQKYGQSPSLRQRRN